MNILGISAFYHDSAAALVQDGEIVAAAQEERFTRKKHDHRFPIDADRTTACARPDCPSRTSTTSDSTTSRFSNSSGSLETYLAFAPRRLPFVPQSDAAVAQAEAAPAASMIREELGYKRPSRFVFTEHHESHAASAFFPSPFEEAAILTLRRRRRVGHGQLRLRARATRSR